MDTNKILSADFLDLLFDNRNKEYGAYELRKTYQVRITRALLFTGLFVGLTFTGVVLANKLTPLEKPKLLIHDINLTKIEPDKPEPIPEPIKEPEPVQVQSEQYTQIKIIDEDVVEPIPTQDDLINAKIDVIQNDGAIDEGIVSTQDIDEGKGLIEEKTTKQPDEPFMIVEVDAKFDGNWEKFLTRNLNAQTPIDNNAPVGNYTVIMQFVVDIDGTVSDIKALSNLGYGLEQEAIRVLKRATKWEPAIQNGRKESKSLSQTVNHFPGNRGRVK